MLELLGRPVGYWIRMMYLLERYGLDDMDKLEETLRSVFDDEYDRAAIALGGIDRFANPVV